ncbi:MAG: glycosyltransferase [Myxococcota bacterium]
MNSVLPIAAIALLAARDRPVVYHAHGLIEEELPAYLPPAAGGLAGRAGAAADRTLPGRARATIVLTPPARDALVARGAAPPRVHVIPPGIDVPAVDRGAVGALRARLAPNGEALVAYAGNADAYQGIGTLLDAAAQLEAGRPARFVFALTGGARTLPRDAGARGIADRAVFLDAGWEETALLLAACDAAVIPRPGPYGFPVKLLNALALGAPVIVHRASAHGLVDGETALLAGDAREFARAIAFAIDDAPRARAIGEAGRMHVRKHHGWEDIAPRIEAVLAEAASPG